MPDNLTYEAKELTWKSLEGRLAQYVLNECLEEGIHPRDAIDSMHTMVNFAVEELREDVVAMVFLTALRMYEEKGKG